MGLGLLLLPDCRGLHCTADRCDCLHASLLQLCSAYDKVAHCAQRVAAIAAWLTLTAGCVTFSGSTGHPSIWLLQRLKTDTGGFDVAGDGAECGPHSAPLAQLHGMTQACADSAKVQAYMYTIGDMLSYRYMKGFFDPGYGVNVTERATVLSTASNLQETSMNGTHAPC